LVERCVRDAEAAGSNPVVPTIFFSGCVVLLKPGGFEIWRECMKIFGLGVPELLIILAVALLIFGPKNLPKLGSALGRTVKNLRDGMGAKKELEEMDEEEEEEPEKPVRKKKPAASAKAASKEAEKETDEE
jgi:sec-independent protein translocase protein TatA